MLLSIVVSNPVPSPFHIPYPFPTISVIKVLFKTNKNTKTQKHKENVSLQLKIFRYSQMSLKSILLFMIQIFMICHLYFSSLTSVPFLSSASALLNYLLTHTISCLFSFWNTLCFPASTPKFTHRKSVYLSNLNSGITFGEGFSVELTSKQN